MTANKSSTAVSREIQSSVYTQQNGKLIANTWIMLLHFFFQRFMVGVSTKCRVFQYLNNLSRPDQQDKMMAVNVPANNWDVHIRTCSRPRTMLTFLELQRRSQWPQFKTAVQTFCLFAFMCWQSYQKIFHASALLSQGESFGTWGDGLISFDAETWRIKVNIRLKSLYCSFALPCRSNVGKSCQRGV